MIQSATALLITKCDKVALQSATAVLLQSVTSVITKCDRYYKVQRYYKVWRYTRPISRFVDQWIESWWDRRQAVSNLSTHCLKFQRKIIYNVLTVHMSLARLTEISPSHYFLCKISDVFMWEAGQPSQMRSPSRRPGSRLTGLIWPRWRCFNCAWLNGHLASSMALSFLITRYFPFQKYTI